MLDLPLKTRFCPSPTGLIHLGNVRTALFNYLLARSAGGEFLLRIEDTDRERSKKEYEEALERNLSWLSLLWDEGPQADAGHGPYHQSKRQGIYNDYYKRLESCGIAYSCFCSPEQLALTRRIQRASGQPPRYPGTCRSLSVSDISKKLDEGLQPTLRFRVYDDKVVKFTDLVRGEQRFASGDIGDFIIRRTDGTSPFMFCNAIDDALMGVTHALRGEDHLTNTPRQVMILEALGLPIPTYGHISLIVAPDGSPLSKRHGSRSIEELQQVGYLPLAVVNYLARLGHYYKNDAYMDLNELSAQFEIKSLSKSPAKYNLQQLDYWQKEAVSRLDAAALWEWLGDEVKEKVPENLRPLFIETVQPNIVFPSDAKCWLDICFGDASLVWSDEHKELLAQVGDNYFDLAQAAYREHQEDYQKIIQHLKENAGVKGKALFQPLRVALTGQRHGPELEKLLALMSPDVVIQRLQEAKQ